MSFEDLRWQDLLDQDPINGLPLVGSTRVMITSMQSLGRLWRDLEHYLGEEEAAKILRRNGHAHGLAMATSLEFLHDWEDAEQWLRAMEPLARLAGAGILEITDLVMDKEKPRLNLKVRCRNGFESELHVENYGISKGPVCHVLAGIIGGYASACLGSEVLARETSCIAQGHDFCSFEARQVGDWGLTPQMVRDYLSLGSVDQEVKRLKAILSQTQEELEQRRQEVERLKESAEIYEDVEGFIFSSESMAQVLSLARKVAASDTSILITGETGTGKELLASYIHRRSGRGDEPLVAINCSALPAPLLESELFGHVKGAFTGADQDKKGLFVAAGAGAIFLDEVGEMPMELQPKLLRALQEREVRPVGGVERIRLEARIIAATNRDLKKSVDQGFFREDLYYRLAVIPLELPPLRKRRADILPLARHFLDTLQDGWHGVSPEALRLMEAYSWPGNVRELSNAMEYASVLAEKTRIKPEHLPAALQEGSESPLRALSADLPTERELVERYLDLVLEETGNNKTKAARILGIGPNTLWRRLKTREAAKSQP